MRHRRGFTLIELIIYVGIFSIAATLLTGVLTTFTRVQLRESATTAVSQEAQFVIQTIQRLVTDASLIELQKDAATSTLKLRMPVAANDPTCIQFSNGTVYLMQGNDGINKQTCFATSTSQAKTLTTSKVVVTSLTFKKFENPPSTDTVKIDLTISYNSTNPQESAISRTLQTAIAKVSAATFDSDIIPSADNTYNVGISANRWKNGLFSGNVGIGTASPDSILHLRGSSPIFTVQPTGVGEISRIRFPNSAGTLVGELAVDTGGNIAITDSLLNSAITFTLKDDAGQLERMRITGSGSVGIGTTGPGGNLQVHGANQATDSNSQNVRIMSTDAMAINKGGTLALGGVYTGTTVYPFGQIAGRKENGTDGNAAGYLQFATPSSGGAFSEYMRITSAGNVGIGTTGPNAAGIGSATVLTVSGSAANNRGVIELRDPNPSAGSTMGIIAATANTTNSARIEMVYEGGNAGRFDFYTHNGTSLAERMRLTSSGTLSIGGGSGKINAGTIDPIYNIDGTRYATYVPAIAGKIREEVTGTVTLRNQHAVIDFDDVPRESDLWLFWQITDFGPRWDDLVVIPAPGFNGRVWYEKDVLRNRLIFSGDRSGEVSFRLAAPRFDHEKWPIKSDAQTGGFEISEKPQSRSLLPW